MNVTMHSPSYVIYNAVKSFIDDHREVSCFLLFVHSISSLLCKLSNRAIKEFCGKRGGMI